MSYVDLMRALQSLPSEQIVAMGLHETSLGNLETATYICDYLATRKKQKFRNQLVRGMASMGFEPIDFLSKAREIAQTFQKTTTGAGAVRTSRWRAHTGAGGYGRNPVCGVSHTGGKSDGTWQTPACRRWQV